MTSTEPVRDAILQTPDARLGARRSTRTAASAPTGRSPRSPTAWTCGWPAGSRVIVRRERPHPGAQLSFTDHDGHRFQAILTDQTEHRRRRPRARPPRPRARRGPHPQRQGHRPAEPAVPRLRAQPRLARARRLAHDLIAWTQRLLLDRRTRQRRAQTTALPTATHRRAARLPRPHRHPAPAKPPGPGPQSSPPPSHAQSAPPTQPDTQARSTASRPRQRQRRRRAQRASRACPKPRPRPNNHRSKRPASTRQRRHRAPHNAPSPKFGSARAVARFVNDPG